MQLRSDDLLEVLKDDPEEYVRRSVANNLNDIAKDHPDRVVEIAPDGTLIDHTVSYEQYLERHTAELANLVGA